jgi:hypothetical protein
LGQQDCCTGYKSSRRQTRIELQEFLQAEAVSLRQLQQGVTEANYAL